MNHKNHSCAESGKLIGCTCTGLHNTIVRPQDKVACWIVRETPHGASGATWSS